MFDGIVASTLGVSSCVLPMCSQGGDTPDTERVRIFVAFEKQESAVKGT